MKTEQLIMLDCTKEGNKELLNKFLWKVKPVAKLLEKNNINKSQTAPIEILEQVIHGLCERYQYSLQQIWTYREEEKFTFYSLGIIRNFDKENNNCNKWIGNVTGKTLWEIVAKGIIKIYADIRRERN